MHSAESRDLVAEDRHVAGFDKVAVNDYGMLILGQGEHEALTIEADRDMLPKLTSDVHNGTLVLGIGGGWWNRLDLSTSLNRKVIRYHLTVTRLTGLAIHGVAHVDASGIRTDHLALRLDGAGTATIGALAAEMLYVEVPSVGLVQVDGQVVAQRVHLSGAACYNAAGLKSARADVSLMGVGQVSVSVSSELTVVIRGMGIVEYHGCPAIKHSISGLGRLVSLDNPQASTPLRVPMPPDHPWPRSLPW